MDLLGGYDSNDDNDDNDDNMLENHPVEAKVQRPDRRFLQAAPSISIMTKRKHGQELIVRVDPSTNTAITEPIQGPAEMDPQTHGDQARGR